MRYGSIEVVTALQYMAADAIRTGDQQAARFSIAGLANAATANHEQAQASQEEAQVYEQLAAEHDHRATQLQIEVEKVRWINGLIVESHEAATEEVADLRRNNEQLYILAHTDAKTGLPNDLAFFKALPRAEVSPKTSLVHFDINGFGVVNKLAGFGEGEGDDVLRRVAACLLIASEEFQVSGRSVFRKGGDELTVIAPNDKVDFYPKPDYPVEVIETREFVRPAPGRKVHYQQKVETPAEREQRLATAQPLRISRGEAIRRRAEELFGYITYVGEYGDKGTRSTIVSISGCEGGTFAEAEEGIQQAKQATKARLLARHPELVANQFTDADKV
jgi:GGDEF domain-containing protein